MDLKSYSKNKLHSFISESFRKFQYEFFYTHYNLQSFKKNFRPYNVIFFFFFF